MKIGPNAPQREDLWPESPTWKEYEAYVRGTLERLVPGARVRGNVYLSGIKSGIQRQIDVLVERSVGFFELKIVVDCKCYGKKVDINDVEAFLAMLDDIRVSKGVLVTTVGYTEAAIKRANNESRDIELRILTIERLSEFQNIGCAIPWKGPVAAVVSPPPNWVVDNENEKMTGPEKCQFSIYPLGHTRESAMRYGAFIYGNIVLKYLEEPTMDAIATRHENAVLQGFPNAQFELLPPIQRTDQEGQNHEPTLFRVGRFDPKYNEYCLYIDHPKGVLLLSLICPMGEDETYVPALRWIAEKAILMDCVQGNAS